METLNNLINEALEIQDFIEILKSYTKKMGFKETLWSFENQHDNCIEVEYEGNYRHVIMLSKSNSRWYLYYNVYSGEKKKSNLKYTNTEVFSTDKEFKEILNSFDKEFKKRK